MLEVLAWVMLAGAVLLCIFAWRLLFPNERARACDAALKAKDEEIAMYKNILEQGEPK